MRPLQATLLSLLMVTCACARSVGVAQQPEPPPPADSTIAPPQARIITVGARKGRTYAIIRMFSDSKSPVIAKVPVGTGLRCFGRDGAWYQVQAPSSGALGWIRDVYVED